MIAATTKAPRGLAATLRRGGFLRGLGPSRHSGCRGRESGQAVVEFALVIPVLMLFIVGILKFGTVYNNYIELTNAVDSGARLFSIERGQGGICAAVDANINAAASDLNPANLTVTFTTVPATTTDVWVNGVEQSGGTCPTLTLPMSGIVSASYPCDLAIAGVNPIPSCKLGASSTETIQ
jgi:Flp pilus assembly protein TadG